MASLYKKQSGVYYLSLCYDGNRLTRSLGTRSYDVAKRIRLKVESNLLNEILYGPVERKRKLTFREKPTRVAAFLRASFLATAASFV
jgi:hypothetical protein